MAQDPNEIEHISHNKAINEGTGKPEWWGPSDIYDYRRRVTSLVAQNSLYSKDYLGSAQLFIDNKVRGDLTGLVLDVTYTDKRGYYQTFNKKHPFIKKEVRLAAQLTKGPAFIAQLLHEDNTVVALANWYKTFPKQKIWAVYRVGIKPVLNNVKFADVVLGRLIMNNQDNFVIYSGREDGTETITNEHGTQQWTNNQQKDPFRKWDAYGNKMKLEKSTFVARWTGYDDSIASEYGVYDNGMDYYTLRGNQDYGHQYGRRARRKLLEFGHNEGFMGDTSISSSCLLTTVLCVGFMILFCVIGGIVYRRYTKRGLREVKTSVIEVVAAGDDVEGIGSSKGTHKNETNDSYFS